jgi:glycosyltransferase involved in cell wall biosynthesis
MKIALMGIRGIPARYGGFETFAEELAPRLVALGHDVTVYGRSNNVDKRYHGGHYKDVRIVVLPTISHKYLDTIAHTFVSVLHAAVFERFDAVLMMNAANAPFIAVPRLRGTKVALNVDGIERLRKKWNRLGQLYYRIGERLATLLPHAIVSDARVIEAYYRESYGAESTFIAYGAHARRVETTDVLGTLGVAPREYVLYVTRFEPENNPHVVIDAFAKVRTDKRLVIVGDAPYASEYKKSLEERAARDPRVLLPGFIYGQGYHELQSNAFCYVQATEVGGTHPALIEAMGAGNCVLGNGTPENIEVLEGCGLIYRKNDVDDLAAKLQQAMGDEPLVRDLGARARARIERDYSWEKITRQYHDLFVRLVSPAPAVG